MGELDKKRIFVFGSNLAGIHGKGAALHAKIHYGAKPGVGVGRTGIAYAIPTKDYGIRTLPLGAIRPFVNQFLTYARRERDLQFNVTQIGCGLAGYQPEQIAPMFAEWDNIWYDPFWAPWIKDAQFWEGPL